jgi:hypothetical protein
MGMKNAVKDLPSRAQTTHSLDTDKSRNAKPIEDRVPSRLFVTLNSSSL